MRYPHFVRCIGFAVSVIVAGCATVAESPAPAPLPKQAPPAPAQPPAAIMEPAPPPAPIAKAVPMPSPAPAVSSVRTVDAYKQQVAEKIAAANPGALADTLPPMLKSVVVLEISIDREGNALDVAVRRSNGFKDLEQAAIASVRRTGKLPAPSPEVLAGQPKLTYLETFLFRADGRYQIRSLAPAQRRAS